MPKIENTQSYPIGLGGGKTVPPLDTLKVSKGDWDDAQDRGHVKSALAKGHLAIAAEDPAPEPVAEPTPADPVGEE